MREWIGSVRQPAARKPDSAGRRALRTSLVEGIPAAVLGNLLGGPLQTAFLLYLGFTSNQIGIVLAIPPFALLVQIAIAFAMQRWRNRRLFMTLFGVGHRTLWVATGLLPLLLPEYAWAPAYIAIWTASFLAGQAGGVIWTSLMADIVPSSVRGKYFGIRNTVHWAVVCFTLLAGGQIMERLPGPPGFVVLFSIGAACIVWNGWALSRYPNPPFQPSASGSSLSMLKRPFADRAFLSATLFLSLFVLAQNVGVPFFSYVMLDLLDFGTGGVTMITMLQNLLMMVSYYYWGVLNGRYPARTLLLWTFPIIAASCAVWAGMAIVPALLVLVVSHALLGIGLAGYNLLVFNFLIGDSPKSERPMYVAVFSACTGFAGFVGPVFGGWLYELAESGPSWIGRFGLTAATGVAMAVLALVVAPLVFRRRQAYNRGQERM